MILYYVNSPDWEVLIDAQQKINYRYYNIVNKYKCEFAFPSTSVYYRKKLIIIAKLRIELILLKSIKALNSILHNINYRTLNIVFLFSIV